MNLEEQFPILVIEQKNRFHCLIKELSILESGDDLTATYEKALKKKIQALDQFKQLDLEGVISRSPSIPQKGNRKFYFSMNFLILALFLMVPITSITLPAVRLLSRVNGLLSEPPAELLISFGKRLDAMPAQKQQELKKSIRLLISQFEPEESEAESP